jgi:multiple RNA-binding domain-containing protein 1
MAYQNIHGAEQQLDQNDRKKPNSQVQAEERRDVENKKKKFKEFLTVMMAGGKKVKDQQWNESFNDFNPTDVTKSRRERKKDERVKKDQKEQEHGDVEPEDKSLKIVSEQVTKKEGVTIIEKEIHKRSTKMGNDRSKQVHIKFNQNVDLHDAIIDDVEEKEENKEEGDKKSDAEGDEIDDHRLYIMNLPFAITEEDLREFFGVYGEIDEVTIPRRRGGLGTGFCFIRFIEPESAINAYANLDKKIYQGRIITILPASKKKENKRPEFVGEWAPAQTVEEPKVEEIKVDDEKSSYKKTKKIYARRNFDDETNWNYLFMSQDAVTEALANKLQLKKGDILNRDDNNLAVRVANIETQIIKETKEWMNENGINLKAIEGMNNRKDTKRSKTMILIKNISLNTTIEELSTYFQTNELIISPSNTLAMAKYNSATQAESVMKKLCYYRLHNIPLYLEYAPQVFETGKVQPSLARDVQMLDDSSDNTNTVFVKNLNFDTSEQKLKEVFENANLKSKILSVKIVRNKADGLQSQGYGFLEFESEEGAKNAMKKLQNCIVDDHMLKLKLAKRDKVEKDKKKREQKKSNKEDEAFVDNDDCASNKLLVKNLAFEANKKDITALFKEVGQIKRVRLPKKASSNSHRGFGFVEFVTVEDAKNAFETLQHSHLYGRKLVIQWAKKTDEINDIKELRNKAEAQQEALKHTGELRK